MPKVISITLPGAPMGKPRMTRSDRWKKRPCVMKYWAYADAVRKAVLEQVGDIPDPELITDFKGVAYFSPPESWSQKKKDAALGKRHRVKPDSSNILKGVEDILFERDEALADVAMKKRYDSEPRVEITIEYEPSTEAKSRPAKKAA